jgi:magnesium transporter
VYVDAALYTKGHRHPGTFTLDGASLACRDPDTFAWLGLFEPSHEEFEAARREFDLHELAVEDAVKAHQRPKLEVYGSTLFAVLKPAAYLDEAEAVEFGEILMFVDAGFVIVVRHGGTGDLTGVRRRLEAEPEELTYGPGSVMLEIIDRVVDEYDSVLQGLEEDIRQVEIDVFSEATRPPTRRIYLLKRELLQFELATRPFLQPLMSLAEGRHELIHPDLHPYFRDAHDHLVRVVDRAEGLSNLLTAILQANLTQVGIQQNEDMRRISAWVAIAAVPTLLAGVWGMNFEAMPELDWWFGYPAAIAMMVAICLVIYRLFRRAGWL